MQSYPKEFYCPITQEVMKDPVIGPDAYTYERKAVVDWLRDNHTSPMTRIPMEESQLVPNLALRHTIEDSMNPKATQETVAIPAMGATTLHEDVKDDLELVVKTMEASEGSGLLHISIVPPKDGNRKPCAFICLIDVSESMGGIGTAEGISEGNKFTVLDLVEHAVKTMIYMLGPEDHMAIIAFSDSAKVVMNLTKMGDDGKKTALQAIDSLQASAGTNIWDALRVGVNMATTNHVCQTINTSLWLFTDGMATLNPPRGIAPTLITFTEGKNPSFNLNTFGFGYSLDSYMLLSVSQVGSGVFCYLPDCNLVGTTFVNCLCNNLAAVTNKTTIEIASEGIADLTGIGCELKKNKIDVGLVQYGQSRDLVLQFNTPKELHFTISVKLTYMGKTIEKTISGINLSDPIAFCKQLSRAKYCTMLIEGLAIRHTKKGDPNFLENLQKLIASLPSKDEDSMKALLRDLVSTNPVEGRVSKAFSTQERIDRWGKHYVRSIVSAHQAQQCHNFKDPGVQAYGGKLFKELQQKADIVFCSLPPPIPSAKKFKPMEDIGEEAKAAAAGAAAAAAGAPQMEEYLSSGGGCFDGEGLVRMADGSFKRVKELVRGDEVGNVDGSKGKVVCVVEFPIHGDTKLVSINGLRITSKHPVKDQGQWVYPADLKPAEKQYCESIYNLVLDSTHIVTINGVEVLTLGHGKFETSVVKHQYYGTERVVEDLKVMRGWGEGKVLLAKVQKLRDPFSGSLMRMLQ